jgi:hypothetical protein
MVVLCPESGQGDSGLVTFTTPGQKCQVTTPDQKIPFLCFRNTYVNVGSVAQFDFHQSGKSKVPLSLTSFVSSNDVMESPRD